MSIRSPQHDRPRNQQLMRYGFAVTGLGILGLVTGLFVMVQGAGVSLLIPATLMTAGLLGTGAGFGMMVVAADPFADCEIDTDSEIASPKE